MRRIIRVITVFFLAFILMGIAQYHQPKQMKHSRSPASMYSNSAKQGRSLSSYRRQHDSAVTPQEVFKKGVQEFSIIVTKNGFYPNKLVVRKNIPVNIFLTTTESRDLCFVLNGSDETLRRGIASAKLHKVSFHPTKTGPFKFYCPINEIEGTLIVRD